MIDEPIFAQYSMEAYSGWETARVFRRYLTMKRQGKLHPDDEREMRKVKKILSEYSGILRGSLYRSLEPEEKEEFKKLFTDERGALISYLRPGLPL